MSNGKRIKGFFLTAALILMGGSAYAQTSSPSPAIECGEYYWPMNPCPEVQIKQKHDHTPQMRYRREGWDTAVTCTQDQLVLSCMPYIPVKRYQGLYYVDTIPYNPPDTTFHQGVHLDITNDDVFAKTVTSIPYPFYFFGIRKTGFVVGSNGIVTFNTAAAADPSTPNTPKSCPWSMTSYSSPIIPWQRSGEYLNDAIMGIYEDTHPIPSYTDSTAPLYQGIYYGVQDAYPCRKIICSWHDVPQYSASSNTNNRCTYQIVCYEGSNIIEVHIKRRSLSSSGWNDLKGVVGILNSTGQPQQPSTNPSDPNSFPGISGKPAAFYPTGFNPTTSAWDTIAFRFTPAGDNLAVADNWYRIFDDGSDSIDLKNADIDPSAYTDPNGYFIPRGSASPTCPTLSKAYVSPTVTSRYVYHLRFQNANSDWYDLYDTITVGVDTVKTLVLSKAGADIDDTTGRVLDVCKNDLANMMIHMTSLQDIDTATTEWQLLRISGNDTTELESSLISYGNITDDSTYKHLPFFINTTQIPNAPENKIDTITLQLSTDFTSGCHNYASMMLRVFPNFDTTTVAGICRGETYHWSANCSDYTESTNPLTEVVHLQSLPGCDSTVRLDLTVFDVSYRVDRIEDCKPITWINGKTYSEDNTATALQDTVIFHNRYDCDSIVQLDFTIHPLTAKIHSNIENFTIDNLEAVLTDVSIGGTSRVWKFPTSADQTGPVAYYSIPVELDGANILLIESSDFGCVDTATIYLPLNKEYFWVPNAFTPDNPSGNNLFGSVSTKTLRQEMIIYNRRGEMVFECQGVDCTWDGRDLNGRPCIQGAYVYVIRYTNEFEPEKTKILTGSVTLIR